MKRIMGRGQKGLGEGRRGKGKAEEGRGGGGGSGCTLRIERGRWPSV